MPYIDFDALKERLPIEDAIPLLGLQMKQSGNQFRGPCPACKGAGPRSIAITPGKGFYCFQASKGGDVIGLWAHVRGLSMKDAALQIGIRLGLVTDPQERTSERSTGTVPRNVPQSAAGEEGAKTFGPLSYLQADHAAVEALGLDPKDAAALGIGYAPRGILRGFVAIPIRLPNGQLAGYIGVNDIAKLPPRWHLDQVAPEEQAPNVVRLRPKSA